MAEQDQDKSELPTPYKLQEAKKKGQIAKSTELNSWLILLTAFGLFLTVGWNILLGFGHIAAFLFDQSGQIDITVKSTVRLLDEMQSLMQQKMWPFFLGLGVVSIIATLVQTGFIFTFFPLKPDIQRLNPVKGLKRLFSKKMLFEAFKNILKLLILIAVFYGVLLKVLPTLPLLTDMPPEHVLHKLMSHASFLVASLLGALLIIAVLDLIHSRRDFMNQMKMSKREVKDESKRREGDPLVRQKRRQLQQELSNQVASMGNVPDADVVITNPTHLSIALKYDRQSMMAPCVVAKGSGASALRIREIARSKNIEIVENKPLARKLFRTAGINDSIPPDLFPLVAQIYIWLNRQKMKNQGYTPT